MQGRVYDTGSEDKLGEVRGEGGAIIVILSARVKRSGLAGTGGIPNLKDFLRVEVDIRVVSNVALNIVKWSKQQKKVVSCTRNMFRCMLCSCMQGYGITDGVPTYI